MLVWSIWKARNSWIFNMKKTEAREIAWKATDFQMVYAAAQEDATRDGQNQMEDLHGWQNPQRSWCKINTDASVKNKTEGGLGVVIRDHNGEVRGAKTIYREVAWEVEAREAGAIKMGLGLAKNLGISQVVVEADCLSVIQALQSRKCGKTSWAAILHDIRNLMLHFQLVKFSYVRRNFNKVAHMLAKYAIENKSDDEWVGACPYFILDAVEQDKTNDVT